MKLLPAAVLVGALFTSLLQAAPEWDLTNASWDSSKPGPDGKPSLKIEPGGKAVLKLSDTDVSGSVSMEIWDDGTVAVPGKQMGIGPRWGVTSANGRVLVGGIMYAKYLADDGSIVIIDADPTDRLNFLKTKWLASRTVATPDWISWSFDFDPKTGLEMTCNSKTVETKRFDWNKSEIPGMTGIVIYGDDTTANPQTIYVGSIEYKVGPPMKIKPGDIQ